MEILLVVLGIVLVLGAIVFVLIKDAPVLENDPADIAHDELEKALKNAKEVSKQYRIFKNGGKLN